MRATLEVNEPPVSSHMMSLNELLEAEWPAHQGLCGQVASRKQVHPFVKYP